MTHLKQQISTDTIFNFIFYRKSWYHCCSNRHFGDLMPAKYYHFFIENGTSDISVLDVLFWALTTVVKLLWKFSTLILVSLRQIHICISRQCTEIQRWSSANTLTLPGAWATHKRFRYRVRQDSCSPTLNFGTPFLSRILIEIEHWNLVCW